MLAITAPAGLWAFIVLVATLFTAHAHRASVHAWDVGDLWSVIANYVLVIIFILVDLAAIVLLMNELFFR